MRWSASLADGGSFDRRGLGLVTIYGQVTADGHGRSPREESEENG
jgi:hypothetical protein